MRALAVGTLEADQELVLMEVLRLREQVLGRVPPAFPPPVGSLVQVLSLEQMKVYGAITITLLSLELYAQGFVLLTRLQSQEPMPFPHVTSVIATDDRGGRYRGGSYGGGATDREARMAYRFWPALDPAARIVEFHFADIRWNRAVEELQGGPWTCTVTLGTLAASG